MDQAEMLPKRHVLTPRLIMTLTALICLRNPVNNNLHFFPFRQGKFATAANPLGFHVLAWSMPLEATPQPLQLKLELRTTSLRAAAAPMPRCLALAGGFDALATNARSPGSGNRRLRKCLAINGMRWYCCADTTRSPIAGRPPLPSPSPPQPRAGFAGTSPEPPRSTSYRR